MKRITAKGVEVVIYESAYEESKLFHANAYKNLAEFKAKVDVIVSNRMTGTQIKCITMIFLVVIVI